MHGEMTPLSSTFERAPWGNSWFPHPDMRAQTVVLQDAMVRLIGQTTHDHDLSLSCRLVSGKVLMYRRTGSGSRKRVQGF